MSSLCRLIFLICFFVSVSGWAQSQNNDDGHPQVGAFVGNLLPNGVDGVEEITSLSGLRYSHPIGKAAYTELGTLFGNSGGVKWQGAFVSLRMDIPLETLLATTYIGLDFTRYEAPGVASSNKGGGHVGGGLMSLIGGSTWVRFDMKLNSKPGTSLYFALGLLIEFGSSDNPGAP